MNNMNNKPFVKFHVPDKSVIIKLDEQETKKEERMYVDKKRKVIASFIFFLSRKFQVEISVLIFCTFKSLLRSE